MFQATDQLTVVLAALVGIMILLLLLARFFLTLKGFKRRLRYIEREIGRTHGKELKYWKRQKRLLWLSLLPFVPYNEE